MLTREHFEEARRSLSEEAQQWREPTLMVPSSIMNSMHELVKVAEYADAERHYQQTRKLDAFWSALRQKERERRKRNVQRAWEYRRRLRAIEATTPR